MECYTFMIICFYCIFLVSIIIELVFLFQVPYYYYSDYLKSLKIIRIIINIINLFIDIYFLVIQYAEKLIKKEEKEEISNDSSSRKYQLFEKILIIIAFSLSFVTFILNIIAIGLTSKYLKTFDSSFIQNSLYIDTLLFLIENTLVSLCWLYFLIFWGFNIKDFMKDDKKKSKIKSEKNNNNENNNNENNKNKNNNTNENNSNEPAPLQQEISSSRVIN